MSLSFTKLHEWLRSQSKSDGSQPQSRAGSHLLIARELPGDGYDEAVGNVPLAIETVRHPRDSRRLIHDHRQQVIRNLQCGLGLLHPLFWGVTSTE